jgi:hypothetical protein
VKIEFLFLNLSMLEIWLISVVLKERVMLIHLWTCMSKPADYISKGVDSTLYKSMIKSLLYITTSRLGIAFSVGVCVRF